MTRSRSILAAVTALLVGAGALAAAAQSTGAKGAYEKPPAKGAVTLASGDDGWVTTKGEGSKLNLADYPIAKIFGVKYASHDKVFLKGKPLSPDLGEIDTIIQRPKDIVLKAKKGSGPLQIAALSLESEKPVKIGDKSYQLRVGLSETQKPGRLTVTQTGKDKGTFSASFPVAPKLVFTPEGGGEAVTIDCGAVPCGKGGKGFLLTTHATPWHLKGVSTDSDALVERKLTPIKAGVRVGGEGSAAYTTAGSSNFVAGVQITNGALVARPIRHHNHEFQAFSFSIQ
jgi:hypothetical protein